MDEGPERVMEVDDYLNTAGFHSAGLVSSTVDGNRAPASDSVLYCNGNLLGIGASDSIHLSHLSSHSVRT